MPGTGTLIRALTAALLRDRLRLALLALVAAITGLAVLDLLSGRLTLPVSFLLPIAVLGAAAMLLFSRASLTLHRLRTLELCVFGSIALSLAMRSYVLIESELRAGSVDQALSTLVTWASEVALLAVAYGVLIPNRWQRAMVVTLALVLTPPAMLLFFQFRNPDMVRGLVVSSSGQFPDATLLLIAGTVISMLGTRIMGHYEEKQVEATEVGFYNLTTQIGSGGMGEVWLAEHNKLVRPAAIKLIRPEMLEDVSADRARRIVRRFEREAQATASLRSVHTIELYDFGIADDGVFYYVMEYLDGIDLADLVKKYGPVSPARAVYLLRQACESLAEAHDRQLIHRDVKPSNIFACRMGLAYDFVKVLDFGLVRTEVNEAEDTQLSVEGATSGTPAFMPPELAIGSPKVDARADVYSLGCVAYWLLTGRLVFESETPLAMMVDHAKEDPQPPSEKARGIPAELDRIVLRCLEKDAANRFQGVRQFSDALARCKVDEWNQQEAARWWEVEQPTASATELRG